MTYLVSLGGLPGLAFFFCQVDLIILPLTSIPLVGFWKLLPTFGGCIATRASCVLAGNNNEVVEVCAGWNGVTPVVFWVVLS